MVPCLAAMPDSVSPALTVYVPAAGFAGLGDGFAAGLFVGSGAVPLPPWMRAHAFLSMYATLQSMGFDPSCHMVTAVHGPIG